MKQHRRTSLFRKGLIVIAVPLLYQLLFIGLLLKRQHAINDAQRWAIHTKDVMTQADYLLRILIEAQGSLRARVITGNPVFDVDVPQLEASVREQIDALKRATQDSPRQQARLDVIAQRAAAMLEPIKRMDHYSRAGESEKAIAEVRSLAGKRSMDALREEIESFRGHEEELDAERLETLREQSVTQTWLLITGAVANVAIGAAMAAVFVRDISGRVAVLTENVRRMSGGRELAPVAPGNDEVADLDRAFHKMADDVRIAREAEREHQQALEHRAGELARANRELDQKNRENEMFVYSVSHDLRSPLVNLQGFSKELGLAREDLLRLLRSDFSSESRERAAALVERDVAEAIHYIQTAVARLAGIIDALLRLSRAGRVEYHPQTIDLTAVVTQITEAMRKTIAQRNAEITINNLPPAWGDATAIEQVFANLIDNAVNYLDPTRPGRIEIGCTDSAASNEERTSDVQGAHIYYVKDNGLGIPAASLQKVFTVFQRFHASAAPGEGIGLALVQRIVERHGGKVWVESKEREGSAFFIALPNPAAQPRPSSVLSPVL